MTIGRIQFRLGYWADGLGSSLAVVRGLPSAPCHVALSIRARMQEVPEGEEEGQQDESCSLGIAERRK